MNHQHVTTLFYFTPSSKVSCAGWSRRHFRQTNRSARRALIFICWHSQQSAIHLMSRIVIFSSAKKMNSMNSHTCEDGEENSTTSMTVKEKRRDWRGEGKWAKKRMACVKRAEILHHRVHSSLVRSSSQKIIMENPAWTFHSFGKLENSYKIARVWNIEQVEN